MIPSLIPDGLSKDFVEDHASCDNKQILGRNLSGPVPEFRAMIVALRNRLATPFVSS